MCDDCVTSHDGSFTQSDGVVWHYRTRSYKYVERSLDRVNWKEISDEDLAEMSQHHIDFVESLLIPF